MCSSDLSALGIVLGPTTSPGLPRPTLPLGKSPIGFKVPVGRVTDLLLHPGGELEHDGRVLRFPPTEVIYSAGGNPFHHNQNLNRFLDGWQRPGKAP